MRRVFTQDRGRYRAGEERDWPLGTWKTFFPDFERFTQPVEDVLRAAVAAERTKKEKRHAA